MHSVSRLLARLDDISWFLATVGAVASSSSSLVIIAEDAGMRLVSETGPDRISISIPASRFDRFQMALGGVIHTSINSPDFIECLSILSIICVHIRPERALISLKLMSDSWLLELQSPGVVHASAIKIHSVDKNRPVARPSTPVGTWAIVSREFRSTLYEILEISKQTTVFEMILSPRSPYLVFKSSNCHGTCDIVYSESGSVFESFQCQTPITLLLGRSCIETAIKALWLSTKCSLMCYREGIFMLRVLVDGKTPMFIELLSNQVRGSAN